MALTFPATPADGDTHTVGSITWTYASASDTWTGAVGGGASSVWETDGTNAWRTANNVGIRTGTPVAAIDVNGTAAHTTVASTGAFDLAVGQVFALDSSGSPTIAFANVPAGKATTVVVKVSGGGTVNWGGVQWPGGTAPSFSTGTDIITLFTNDGGATWVGSSFALDAQ